MYIIYTNLYGSNRDGFVCLENWTEFVIKKGSGHVAKGVKNL